MATESITLDGHDPLKVIFSEPMVEGSMIGPAGAEVPVTLSPEVKGNYAWTNERTLVFTPDAIWPPSTRLTVKLRPAARSLTRVGPTLGRPLEALTFTTTRLDGSIYMRTRYSDGAGNEIVDGESTAILRFNQPVAWSQVHSHCKIVSEALFVGGGAATLDPARPSYSGAVVRVRGQYEKELEDPSTMFTLGNFGNLPKRGLFSIGCDGQLMPAAGELPVEKNFETNFATHGPFVALGVEVAPMLSRFALQLSTPIADVSELKVDPPLEGFPGERKSMAKVHYNIALKPNTDYVITLPAGTKDVFGQSLAKAEQVRFRTEDYPAQLSFETGHKILEAQSSGYPVWTRNVEAIEVVVAKLSAEQLFKLLPALDWWDKERVNLGKLGIKASAETPIRTTAITGLSQRNKWKQTFINPGQLLSTKPQGIYYLAVREKAASGHGAWKEALVNITDLALVSKSSGANGAVWVTRLSTGKVVADAEVKMVSREGQTLWQGKTQSSGWAEVPGRQILADKQRAASPKSSASQTRQPSRQTHNDVEGEGSEEGSGDEGEPHAQYLAFISTADGDVTFVDPLRPGELAAYNFGVEVDPSQRRERLRGFIETDRGLYRPGETVHVKGLVRALYLAEPLKVPSDAKPHALIKSPRGDVLFEKDVSLSRFGGYAFDFAVPKDARLGGYEIEVNVGNSNAGTKETFSQQFSVEEYKPATFEVKAQVAANRYIVGNKLEANTTARYFYGAPVGRGKVSWRLLIRPLPISFADYPTYSFGDEVERGSSGTELATESTAVLSAQGTGAFSFKKLKQPGQYIVESEVADETKQSIASRATVPVYGADIAVGLDVGSTVLEAKKAHKVQLVAVDLDGKRVATTADVTIIRSDWTCAWQAHAMGGRYHCERKDQSISKQSVSISAQGQGGVTSVPFTPPASGEYVIRVAARDGSGRKTSASSSVWVWGGGGGYRPEDGPTFEMIADKPSYRPGEVAHLLLKTAITRATALVTIERDGVIEYRVAPFEKGHVEIPIREIYGPNAYASVVLVTGRTGAGVRGRPLMRMGLINLPVEVGSGRKLAVAVSTDRPSYRPGEQVTADIKVTDDKGRGVVSEVALAAADEGVLSLIAYRTPNPLDIFYSPWGLGVSAATQINQLPIWTGPNEAELEAEEAGDGMPSSGGEGPSDRVRSRFMATAYFEPMVQTDGQGFARVKFTVPDNLTAYRVMAVAADLGPRFGSVDRRFAVAKPLMVISALPRFLSMGDKAAAAIVVHNQATTSGKLSVRASIKPADGQTAVGTIVLEGDARGGNEQKMDIGPGERKRLTFAMTAKQTGPVTLRFDAVLASGGHQEKDSVELALPVNPPGSAEKVAIADASTEKRAEINLSVPKGVLPGTGVVRISVDPLGVAGIEEGLRSLIEYPYGCLEQTTSRLIPLLAIKNLTSRLDLPSLADDEAKIKRLVVAGLEKMGRFQQSDGGFALWQGQGGQSDPYLTALALWVLHVGKSSAPANTSQGAPPAAPNTKAKPSEDRRVEDGLRYLKRTLPEESNRLGDAPFFDPRGELGNRAFALYVLSLLGKGDGQLALRLAEKRAELPQYGKAFLAQALAGSPGVGAGHALVSEMVTELERSVETVAGIAQVREPNGRGLHYYMSDDTRTTAIVLGALLSLRPKSPAIPALVRGLMKLRKQSPTTQSDMYGLLAIDKYLATASSTPRQVFVELAGKTVASAKIPEAGRDGKKILHVEVPFGSLSPEGQTKLNIRSEGGAVFYNVRSEYHLEPAVKAAMKIKPLGFSIQRKFLDPKTKRKIATFRVGDTVLVRTKVDIKGDDSRSHVAVTDGLPAAFEIVSPKLAVSAVQPGARPRWGAFEEFRDERVDYFSDWMWKSDTVEYLVKVQTAGRFFLPPAVVEEMYAPGYRAATKAGTIEVLPPSEAQSNPQSEAAETKAP